MTSPIQFRSFNQKYECNDDGNFSYSSTEQKRIETMLFENYNSLVLEPFESTGDADLSELTILRQKHIAYLLRYLKNCPSSYATLDASRSWMCYWAVNALKILDADIPAETVDNIIAFLKSCEHPKGGYGGGPGQLAHLAPTYAAVMCLVSFQKEEALKSINKETLFNFLKTCKHESGGFYMHEGGEIDMRSAYCALATCEVVGLPLEEISGGVAEWIISCQSYEGGFGGEPYTEAHGGYTFCAVASLVLLNRFRLADLESLLRWATRRQMRYEGGFQGRTNKLVDGCYSFWQGAIFPLLDGEMEREGKSWEKGLFEARMLEEYILIGCQSVHGGFRDKPDKPVDLYHTCYVLSGLSVAQKYSLARDGNIVGGDVNMLVEINPVFNVTVASERFAKEYFTKH
ncbi:CBN-FNTB-1 protein [Caenorhabditis brenneri]|uniref:Protein farnesyltransferase subunit beta n=1 Tax=Caenorhabditis brenneri TaxID=135651 RepID=G0NWT4_CAEBE|nr:CBN-FNTB-1 protein [Caenorhabditis brenneri]